jgi:hypothetical protein
MPNIIAYTALVSWPFITLGIFSILRPSRALVYCLLAGYLFLPVKTAFDFPGVPALDKTSIANLSALLGALIFSKGPVIRLPREWWICALMAIYVVSPMMTVLTNRDPLFFGGLVLPGLKPYDALSVSSYKAIDLIPFFLGYNILVSARSHRDVLQAFVIAGIFYSLLMLVEIRLSPQLHNWVYGFFPHSFAQQVRDGAFRPVVFLGHGLLVAIFTAMSLGAAAYFAQRRERLWGVTGWAWLLYLAGLLILSRSLGALLIASAVLLAMFTVSRQRMRLVCALLAITVLAYPALRGAELAPVQSLNNRIAAINEDRAESFQVRIDNENALLAKANQRPWFGWGGYGRNRIYDDDSGKDLSVTDGTWIIVAGTSGWVGYLATFGLLCLPIVFAWKRGIHFSASSAAVSLLLIINLLDLIPNSSLSPLTWLLAGSLVAVLPRSGNRR